MKSYNKSLRNENILTFADSCLYIVFVNIKNLNKTVYEKDFFTYSCISAWSRDVFVDLLWQSFSQSKYKAWEAA